MSIEDLWIKIFPNDYAIKLINRKKKTYQTRPIIKQLLISRLKIPESIEEIIKSYCFQPLYVSQHKKYMRKIVYIFKNARTSRFSDEKNNIPIREHWFFCASRKAPPCYIPCHPPLLVPTRNHFVNYHKNDNTVQDPYIHLFECSFSASNCIKCGNYLLTKKYQEHYRELRNRRKWKEFCSLYGYPYFDKLFCNCK
jgi:hypothetical protein